VTNPEKAGDRTLAGKCLCGAVHYAVADEFVYAANCHCSNCRRATGSAFKPFARIERNKLAISGGSGNLMIYGDENGHDAHCKVCGSLLYSVVRDGTFVHAMGTLIDDPTIRPTAHIFVGSKARWFTITDDLPQYEEHVVAAGATASPTRNILMTMFATVFRWAVWGPPRRWPMSLLFWRRRAPIGSTAETYRLMGWSNPTRPWIGGHFSVWRGIIPG
jgi:hypothetical protein